MYTINRTTTDGQQVVNQHVGDDIHPLLSYAHAELDRIQASAVEVGFEVIRSGGGRLAVRHFDGQQVCVHTVTRAGR